MKNYVNYINWNYTFTDLQNIITGADFPVGMCISQENTMGEIATLMRMGFYVDPRKQPGVKAYVDREFIGVSEPDLHLQIRYYITKYGIAEAFNIKIQENTDEESERST